MNATEKRRGWKVGDGAKKLWKKRKEARKKRRKLLKQKLGIGSNKSEKLAPIEQAEDEDEDDSSDYDEEASYDTEDIFHSSIDFFGDDK